MPLSGTIETQISYKRTVSGPLTFSGAIGRANLYKRLVQGVLNFVGSIEQRIVAKNVFGVLGALVGSLSAKLNGIPVGFGFRNVFIGKRKKAVFTDNKNRRIVEV